MKKAAGVLIIAMLAFQGLLAEEAIYIDQSFARLSYLTGETFIQKASELNYEEGTVNMPISEGDRIGTTGGRVEIYIPHGTYLRMDDNTKLDLLQLPKEGSDLIQIKVFTGHIYLSVRNLSRERSIEIITADLCVYILDNGVFRIDVNQGGETEVLVYSGIVEIAGNSGSILVKDSQRLEAINGYFSDSPERFMEVSEDGFDRWSEYRDTQVRKRIAQSYLPDELQDFEYELSEYGRWIRMPDYGNVWVPAAEDQDWRPYYHGRWRWNQYCGWTWIPYETWGWVTSHYGRWHWSLSHGWYWIPTSIWGPGWVSWYSGPDYWAWAPLSYYGHPGVIINNIYHDRYTDYGYPLHSPALTMVHKQQLSARNISKVALKQKDILSLSKLQLTGEIPRRVGAGNIDSRGSLDGNPGIQEKLPVRDMVNRPGKTSSARLKSIEQTEEAGKSKTGLMERPAEKSTDARKIPKRARVYPPSSQINAGRSGQSDKKRASALSIGKFYESISGRSGVKSGVKKGSSQAAAKKPGAGSRAKSTKPPVVKQRSKSSGAAKAKKKKK